MTRRFLWQIILGVTIVCSAGLFLLLATADTPLKKFAPAVLRNDPPPPEPKPQSKFYQFDTISQFALLDEESRTNTSREHLCQSFPTGLLRDIQPVLKSGHGVINTRVKNSFESCSACLDNVLILSDYDEDLNGRPVVDVIGDLSSENLEQEQLIPYKALNGLPVNGTIQDPNITHQQAWGLDKFKFLLGISRAWRMRPEKRWYVFYEGDTFVVWDNVFRMLENFDPDTPHYFGSPSPGMHDKNDKVTWFANGGPGYIISRAAMRRLIKNDWDKKTGEYLGSKLTEKHWDRLLHDCCGDSVLGWALWKEKVPLEGIWPSMNPHPLHGVPFSDLQWCQPVLSMHKLHEPDMVDFWHWEWANRDRHRPLLYRDLALSFLNLTTITTRSDWDNADWDGFPPPPEGDPHVSTQSCEVACKAHDGCFQWTYHLKRCTFVRSFRLGSAKEPRVDKDKTEQEWSLEDQRFTAGWDTKKIQQWTDKRQCDVIEWVRPSITRIM